MTDKDISQNGTHTDAADHTELAKIYETAADDNDVPTEVQEGQMADKIIGQNQSQADPKQVPDLHGTPGLPADGDSRVPPSCHISPDTASSSYSISASRPLEEHPLAGVVGNYRGDVCRPGRTQEDEVKKSPCGEIHGCGGGSPPQTARQSKCCPFRSGACRVYMPPPPPPVPPTHWP